MSKSFRKFRTHVTTTDVI